MPEMVKLYRKLDDGSEATCEMPAAVVAAWAADGWQVVPATGARAEVAGSLRKSAEQELAEREAAEAEAVETAKEAAKTARTQAKENK